MDVVVFKLMTLQKIRFTRGLLRIIKRIQPVKMERCIFQNLSISKKCDNLVLDLFFSESSVYFFIEFSALVPIFTSYYCFPLYLLSRRYF